jgi:hypothetical protein
MLVEILVQVVELVVTELQQVFPEVLLHTQVVVAVEQMDQLVLEAEVLVEQQLILQVVEVEQPIEAEVQEVEVQVIQVMVLQVEEQLEVLV